MFACEPDLYPTPIQDYSAQGGLTCAAGGQCEVGDVRLSDLSIEESASGPPVIGVPEIMVSEATWLPICGHYLWDNHRAAELLCHQMGYRSGALHTGSAEAFPYSTDAYRIGLCLDSDESLMSCTGGCNDYTGGGRCQNNAGAECNAGQPVGFRIACQEIRPMFVRVWLR